MALVSEKKIHVAGFQFGVTADAERAERIRRSKLYRYVVRPGLRIVGGRPPAPPVIVQPAHRPAVVPPPGLDDHAVALWERVSRIGWYHTIDLGGGVVTPGFIDNRESVPLFGLPDDLTGKRCLDIGTYDGFWAFEMERRGASEVVGIDVDSPLDHDVPRRIRARAIEEAGVEQDDQRRQWSHQQAGLGLQYPGEGFQLAKEALGSKARREVLNVYDLAPARFGMFDVVMISQLLLRLRDPQTIIENIFSVTRDLAIVAEPYDPDLERLSRPLSEFVGTTVLGVWWRHSIKSMRKMMEVAGFEPVEEVSRFAVENRAGRFRKVVLRGHMPATAA